MNIQDIYLTCVDVEPDGLIHLYLSSHDFHKGEGADWVYTFKDLPGALKKTPVRMFKIKNGGIHAVLEVAV